MLFMKILQLCKKFPYPLNDGESVAVTSLAKSLQQLGCEVTLLAMNTSKHYVNINDLPKSFNHYKAIHTVLTMLLIDDKLVVYHLFPKDKEILPSKSIIFSIFYLLKYYRPDRFLKLIRS